MQAATIGANMKMRNTTRFIFNVSLLAILWAAAGCAVFELGAPQWARSKPPSDPLADWQPADYIAQPNETIVRDYQDYIQKLPSEERENAGLIRFFRDEAGQHAIKIIVPLKGTEWDHILIYDKDNKRIQVIKYASGNYRS